MAEEYRLFDYCQAMLEPLVAELRGIRVALEVLTAAPAAVEPEGCQHPLEKRIDFGVTGGVDDWHCGICGFRTIPSGSEEQVHV